MFVVVVSREDLYFCRDCPMWGTIFNFTAATLLPWLEAVSNPGFRDEVTRRGSIRFKFFSQLPDKDTEIFHLICALAAPDGTQKRPVREDFARMARHVDE